jgi:hypothetical protein
VYASTFDTYVNFLIVVPVKLTEFFWLKRDVKSAWTMHWKETLSASWMGPRISRVQGSKWLRECRNRDNVIVGLL